MASKKPQRKLKTPVVQSEEEVEKMQQVMVINLGYELKGNIKQDAVEGELNTPKWNQAGDVSSAIASLLEGVNQLEKGSVKSIQRIADIGHNRLLAQVTLIFEGNQKVDLDIARKVAQKFVEETTQQAILPWQIQGKDEGKYDFNQKSLDLIKVSADNFLKTHGGQAVRAGMQIQIRNEEVAMMQGMWKQIAEPELPKQLKRELQGFYDGRRLRQRCFYLVEATKKAKNHEVFYDDNEFDDQLRALADDKNAAVKVCCLEVPMGKKIRLFLDEMEVIQLEDFG